MTIKRLIRRVADPPRCFSRVLSSLNGKTSPPLETPLSPAAETLVERRAKIVRAKKPLVASSLPEKREYPGSRSRILDVPITVEILRDFDFSGLKSPWLIRSSSPSRMRNARTLLDSHFLFYTFSYGFSTLRLQENSGVNLGD